MVELNKIGWNKQQTANEVKRNYSELTTISRTFFSMQLNQHPLHQTTDEWMVTLQNLSIDNSTKTSFFQFLRQADAVKFAKYVPPAQEGEESVIVIRQMLKKAALLASPVHSNYQPK
jgi:hypothetical protein